jgi:Fe2+ transport system protein FeoA
MPGAPLSTFTPFDGELEILSVNDLDEHLKRLCELGVCPGKRVTIIRGGNPAILRIGESRFALSLDFLTKVFVRPAA